MKRLPIGEIDPQPMTEARRRAVPLMIGLRYVLLVETVTFLTLLVWWLVLLGFGFAVAWSGIVLTVLVVTTIGAIAIRKLWRRRFRFDLRTMFALVSLAALVSWWLAYYVPTYTQEQRVNRAAAVVAKYRAAIRKQHVNGDENAPLLACDVDFNGSPLTDGELVDLAGHSDLTGLNLRGSRVTDRGMSCLARFPLLDKIDISQTGVTAVGVAQLRHIPTLSTLTLDGNQLRQLAAAPKDAIPLVGTLWLDSEGIDDQAISDLQRWENLDRVVVIRAKLTDNGLAQLGRLTALTYLHVEGSAGVTDVGVRHLRSLDRLKLLCVVDTGATELAGAELQKLLPNCHILVGQRTATFYQSPAKTTIRGDRSGQ